MPNKDFPSLPKAGVILNGVPLDVLARRLGGDQRASAIEAICADGYTAIYSREYIRQHHPVFVLTIDGLSLHDWAIRNHQLDAEPYFISYRNFRPAFHVLRHQDLPLEPTGLVKMRFGTIEQVYETVRPKPINGSTDLAVMQGYRIARQSCLRCHNAGDDGGTKAAKDWKTLGGMAQNQPDRFVAWVRDPQAIDPQAEMPANPEYDKATLDALQRYFATFAASSMEGQ